MATAAGAIADLRAQLEAGTDTPLYFQAENNTGLPDLPDTFGYVEFQLFPARIAGFGAGRGNNLYRTDGIVVVRLLVPMGEGLPIALAAAEDIADILRSYRSSEASCFAVSIRPGGDGAAFMPPGLSSPVNNYYCVIIEIDFSFDQVG